MMQSVKARAFNILLIRIIKIGQSILTFFIMAGLIDKSEFGYYAFSYSIALSMVVLSYFGSEQYGLKTLAKSHLFIGRLLCTKLTFSIVFVVIFLCSSNYLFPGVSDFFVVCLSVFILFNFELLIFNYFNVLNRLDLLVKNITTTFLITSGIKFYSLWLGNSEALYFSMALDSIIPFILFYFIALNSNHLSFRKSTLSKFHSFFKKHQLKLFLLFLSTLLIQINIRVDSYFVSVYLGGKELSSYSMALKFNEVFAVLVSSNIALYSPSFYRSQSVLGLVGIARKILIVTFSLYVIASTSLFLMFDIVNNYLLSGEYYESKRIILILFVGTFFSGVSTIISMWYIYNGREASKTKRVLISLLINITLSYFLIPRFGVVGAAFVNLVINFTLAVILNSNVKELRGFFKEILCR